MTTKVKSTLNSSLTDYEHLKLAGMTTDDILNHVVIDDLYLALSYLSIVATRGNTLIDNAITIVRHAKDVADYLVNIQRQ